MRRQINCLTPAANHFIPKARLLRGNPENNAPRKRLIISTTDAVGTAGSFMSIYFAFEEACGAFGRGR
ncbi:hypothetical protein VZT92_004108 [Zoarces viviparus]|uniref:Uncharacterized protein n=1 Tax=Zoarces viviparus TaxID=48416 RepID=A0AAW1FVG4_ZOAVI